MFCRVEYVGATWIDEVVSRLLPPIDGRRRGEVAGTSLRLLIGCREFREDSKSREFSGEPKDGCLFARSDSEFCMKYLFQMRCALVLCCRL